MFAPVAEIGIVTFVLDQTAGMSDGGAVTLEKAAELEEAASRRVSEKLAAEVNAPSVGRC